MFGAMRSRSSGPSPETIARRKREAEEYKVWFNSLTPAEKNAEIALKAKEEKKQKREMVALLIFAFLLLFVGWPLVAMQMSRARWQSEWNRGKFISEDAKQICKEVEYCAPCSPLHHWHKDVFCEPK